MRLERIENSALPLWGEMMSLYAAAFPYEERRDAAEQDRVMKNPSYHTDAVMREGKFVGIMFYWEREDYVYLEHFAVLPAERNRGIGAEALELLGQKGKTVLLEIEIPSDELTTRRLHFYERNGFVMNPYRHIQAKYHRGDADLELKIMSRPAVLPPDLYASFYDYMTREIGIQ